MVHLKRGIFAILIVLAGGHPAAHASDGVTARDDAFVVRADTASPGSPGSGGGSGGAVVILEPVCVMGVLPTSPQPGSGCLTLSNRSCPPGESFVREWTAGGGTWVQGAVSCRDLTGAPTVGQVAALARDRVLHHVPRPRISVQPAARPLVTIPVLVHSGQPEGDVTWDDEVVGIPVTTTVSARWTWDFGDGTTLSTADAGSRWPDTAVSHTYRVPGSRTVNVTAIWDGTFRIGSLAIRAIGGAVTQHDSVRIDVVTAASRLRPTR